MDAVPPKPIAAVDLQVGYGVASQPSGYRTAELRSWAGPLVGLRVEGIAKTFRYGVAVRYEYATFEGANGVKPRSHMIQTVLLAGFGFDSDRGIEHGPRLGLVFYGGSHPSNSEQSLAVPGFAVEISYAIIAKVSQGWGIIVGPSVWLPTPLQLIVSGGVRHEF